jgi:transcriptional regulator with XRE-family HTH domain
MASPQFSNYLLSHRKSLSLSQEEVAFLLGNNDGAQVSRYERFVREPNLETSLALEVIFQRSASELFGGLYQRIEQEVTARAKILSNRVDIGESKRQIFINIANKSLN